MRRRNLRAQKVDFQSLYWLSVTLGMAFTVVLCFAGFVSHVRLLRREINATAREQKQDNVLEPAVAVPQEPWDAVAVAKVYFSVCHFLMGGESMLGAGFALVSFIGLALLGFQGVEQLLANRCRCARLRSH